MNNIEKLRKRMQEIGSIKCKECNGLCLPDIYRLCWVCQNCNCQFILKGE